MKFTKMHGCGNDYVYVNLFEEKLDYIIISTAMHFCKFHSGHLVIGFLYCSE